MINYVATDVARAICTHDLLRQNKSNLAREIQLKNGIG